MTTITLSNETIEILKNISTINNSIAFKKGNRLKAISNTNTICIDAEVHETFPIDFAIYELSKFLNVLSLPNMKNAELVFSDDTHVTIKSGETKIVYYFTDPNFVLYPEKELQLPSIELSVSLLQDDIDNFLRASSALGHKLMKFRVKDGQIDLVATTPDIDTSNDYVMNLGTNTEAKDGEYNIRVEYIKLILGDYDIEICEKGLSKFTHKQRPIVYFIGLERV